MACHISSFATALLASGSLASHCLRLWFDVEYVDKCVDANVMKFLSLFCMYHHGSHLAKLTFDNLLKACVALVFLLLVFLEYGDVPMLVAFVFLITRCSPQTASAVRLADMLATIEVPQPQVFQVIADGKTQPHAYGELLVSMLPIYQFLESSLMCLPGWYGRTRQIQADVDQLTGHPSFNMEAERYLMRLEELRGRNPLLLLPHAYIRYACDLNNGRALRTSHKCNWVEDGPSHFSWFRQEVERLSVTGVTKDELISECHRAMRWNQDFVDRLDRWVLSMPMKPQPQPQPIAEESKMVVMHDAPSTTVYDSAVSLRVEPFNFVEELKPIAGKSESTPVTHKFAEEEKPVCVKAESTDVSVEDVVRLLNSVKQSAPKVSVDMQTDDSLLPVNSVDVQTDDADVETKPAVETVDAATDGSVCMVEAAVQAEVIENDKVEERPAKRTLFSDVFMPAATELFERKSRKLEENRESRFALFDEEDWETLILCGDEEASKGGSIGAVEPPLRGWADTHLGAAKFWNNHWSSVALSVEWTNNRRHCQQLFDTVKPLLLRNPIERVFQGSDDGNDMIPHDEQDNVQDNECEDVACSVAQVQRRERRRILKANSRSAKMYLALKIHGQWPLHWGHEATALRGSDCESLNEALF